MHFVLKAGRWIVLVTLVVLIMHFSLEWPLRSMPVRGLPVLCPEPPAGNGSLNTKDFAYVTYLATPDYMPGVEALLTSLFRTNTPYPIVIMVTSATRALTEEHIERWSHICNHTRSQIRVTEVEYITADNRGLRYKRYAHNWTKVQIFNLPFRKVIFIDADAVVLRNLDHLFNLPGPIAGASVYSPDDFNSGVMVAAPCQELFNDMRLQLEQMTWDLPLTQMFFVYYFGRTEILWLPWRYNARPSNNDPLEGAYVAHVLFKGKPKAWASKEDNVWIRKWREFQCSVPMLGSNAV